jgi:hypothetical protein
MVRIWMPSSRRSKQTRQALTNIAGAVRKSGSGNFMFGTGQSAPAALPPPNAKGTDLKVYQSICGCGYAAAQCGKALLFPVRSGGRLTIAHRFIGGIRVANEMYP